MRGHYPCSLAKACYCLWAVKVQGWSLTKAAIEIGLNSGTVCHVIHGRRFPNAVPVPMPGY